MNEQDILKAWLCIKSAPEIRGREMIRLLQTWGDPCEFVGNPAHDLYRDDSFKAAGLDYLANFRLPENHLQITKLAETYEIKVLGYTDPAYPLGLKEIYSPPPVLYYRGDLLTALDAKCLAVVGTRKPSAYGQQMCGKTLAPVCKAGVTIISGLAMGIDTISHLTALEEKTKTIAVLASGVETIYPPQNRELAKRVIQSGALVSEYEPGTKVEKWNFPARNRIVSALSSSVYVVEGPITSGAMLTAKYAIEQNRDLLALPGQINHANAQGPNHLIKNGARPITCPEDLLEQMGIEIEEDEQLQALPELTDDEQKVLDIFEGEQRELFFDELLLITGLSFGKLSIILLNLELKRCIAKASGNSFVLY